MTHPDDLRDPELTALFRRTLGAKPAPESWVRDALTIPSRLVTVPTADRAEPWWILLAPHFGALILVAGAATLLLHPAGRGVLVTHVPRIETQAEALWTLAGLLTPLVLILCAQGSRGFPGLRRFMR